MGIITPFAKQRAAIEAMLRAKHFENAACGTVHAFQGDEKDVVIFSLALTDQTRPRTYDWLKIEQGAHQRGDLPCAGAAGHPLESGRAGPPARRQHRRRYLRAGAVRAQKAASPR